MRKHLGALLIVVALSGCYVRGSGAFHVHANPIATLANVAITTAVIAATIAPPVIASVEYYDYGARPGYVWVNGRHSYVNGAYTWQAGFWQPERPNHYWIQGHWQAQGNQWVWVDGQWAGYRQGYVYTGGYYDYQNNGYVWNPGVWEVDRPGYVFVGGAWSNTGGRRTWVRGGWQYDDGRAEWGVYRRRHYR